MQSGPEAEDETCAANETSPCWWAAHVAEKAQDLSQSSVNRLDMSMLQQRSNARFRACCPPKTY